jgi:hypothetical protein
VNFKHYQRVDRLVCVCDSRERIGDSRAVSVEIRKEEMLGAGAGQLGRIAGWSGHERATKSEVSSVVSGVCVFRRNI